MVGKSGREGGKKGEEKGNNQMGLPMSFGSNGSTEKKRFIILRYSSGCSEGR